MLHAIKPQKSAVRIGIVIGALMLILGLVPIAGALTVSTDPLVLASPGPLGLGGNGASHNPTISADGMRVVYGSGATDLVDGVASTQGDIYLYDVATDTVTLVTGGPLGQGGNGSSSYMSISADGSTIVFSSSATDLIDGISTTAGPNIFSYDIASKTTTLVSFGPSAVGGNGPSVHSSISADGTRIAFISQSSDLVNPATTTVQNTYLWDATSGTVTLVSAGLTGTGGDQFSSWPRISLDGSHIAFASYATNLVTPFTANSHNNVYLYSAATSSLTLISKTPLGLNGNAGSESPSISAEGTRVVFVSYATDLLDGVTFPGYSNVFLYDEGTDALTLVSAGPLGDPADASCDYPTISADGSHVAFESFATNLIAGFDSLGLSAVYLYDGATSEMIVTTADLMSVNPPVLYEYPLLSSDGRYLSFMTWAPWDYPGPGSGFNVYRYDAIAGQLLLITPGSTGVGGNSYLYDPRISQDGSHIVFWSSSTDLIDGITTTEGTNVFVWPDAPQIPETFTVTFAPGSHGTFAAVTHPDLVAGTTTPAPPVVTGQTGWVFAGWSPALQDTVTGDVTYVAQWERDPGTTGPDIPPTGDANASVMVVMLMMLGGVFSTASLLRKRSVEAH